MNVVIVESPAKAKTINKYLGPGFQVLASFGHIRDLPAKEGSVQPDKDFAMTWAVDGRAQKRLGDIAKAVKGAEHLYLATDPDREGEAISWHVLEVLKQKKVLDGVDVKRVVFNEITESAVKQAIAHPRDIHAELVEAYLARRALDYLVGFTLSPVLWRKLPGARSAGRVQSVALRLICDRELEIDRFIPQEYWRIGAKFTNHAGDEFTARLFRLDGEKLDKLAIGSAEAAEKAAAAIRARNFSVASVESKPVRRHPQPPFTTSTLQQEAARKLGFSARHTMRVAQSLYEGKSIDGEVTGLITYMRTDGVTIANEALSAARKVIGAEYGDRYLPESPRVYKSKAKNAQEAHEAIRPTSLSRRPEAIASALDEDERRLYGLIWQRTLASQMASAEIEQTAVSLNGGDDVVELRANGSVMRFDGFLKLYQEGRDDAADENDRRLPPLKEGEAVALKSVEPTQHFTEPPPRFTEASLVRKLEELGIGRPSTYASILTVLRERNYVHMDRNRFVPEDKGQVVTAFLESFFGRYVEYDYTAGLEEQLDRISAGDIDWKAVLNDFWHDFQPKTEEVLAVRNADVLEHLNEYLAPHIFRQTDPDTDPRKCPTCDDGRLSLKVGRYGVFIGCSNYPECRYTRPFGDGSGENGANGKAEENGAKVLGTHPESGLEITLRSGRFGPYVQAGEAAKGEKPPRAGIPKDVDPQSVDLDKAVQLLSLPREIGPHPETGKPVRAGIGRYGPYIEHEGKYASLPTSDEVFTVGLNRAVTLLAERRNNNQRRGAEVIKELGAHPDDGAAVRVLNGRYGPYVNHAKINATVPKGRDPASLSLEEAVELLAAKAAKGGGRRRRARS